MNVQEFAERQLFLLSQEQAADATEIAETFSSFSPIELQRRGYALLNVQQAGMRTGLGGKCLVDFEPALGSNGFPTHKFRMGDIVAIDSGKSFSDKSFTGVVYRLTDKRLTIAFEDDLDQFENRCNLLKLSNEITFQRLKKAILKMKELADQELLSTLFNPSKKPFYQTLGKPVEWMDKDLNSSQRSAVEFALSAQHVALIHGPPGTGKTQTCVEVIRQLVNRGERVLVCGPSNLSVDNLVERLGKSKIPMVRIGHPARILDSVLLHSLEVRANSSDEGQIANDVRKEMDMILRDMSKCRNRAERRQKWGDIKSLRKELKNREIKVVEDILNNAKIVLCTLNGAAGNKVYELVKRQGLFDTVLIDEAAQALEIECWIALLQAKKFILAGDHLQLPPTIKSEIKIPALKPPIYKDLKQVTLEYTLFDRLLDMYGTSIKRLLTTQYRMHESIMEFSSKALYDDELIAHESVKDRLLMDLPHVTETEDTSCPVVFMDTSGHDYNEKSQADNDRFDLDSKYNEEEARLVQEHVNALIQAGVQESEIAIISPYNAQVSTIRNLLKETYPSIEIGSVDGFQGREKEAILISLVRSNDEGNVGFLKEKRRLNVAMTRARRHLFVVGDGDLLSRGDEFLKQWIDWLRENADFRYPF